jgi:DNA-binding NarL/FixJ family response regulator
VLVDIGLPDGDGFFLSRQLTDRGWAARVVIFSSDADPSNSAAAERAGAVGFFPKDELLSPALQHLIEDGADDDR